MEIFLLQLYVWICCGAAVSDLVTDLGSDVIINCGLDENEVYWIFLKTPDPPTVILRSFSTTATPFYFNDTYKKKYSVLFKHRLVINNVTAAELGVYYCMDSTPLKVSNSTRIYIDSSAQQTVCQNHTVVSTECILQNNTMVNATAQIQTQWKFFLIISGVMNGLLIMVVIGLVKVLVVGNRKSAERPRQLNTDLQQTQVIEQNQDQLQYATMDFSKMRKKHRPSQVNSTYSAVYLHKL